MALIFIILGFVALAGFIAAVWELICLFTRKLLSIPDYVPFEETNEPIPYYLKNRPPLSDC
jgi:hypothetical protein